MVDEIDTTGIEQRHIDEILDDMTARDSNTPRKSLMRGVRRELGDIPIANPNQYMKRLAEIVVASRKKDVPLEGINSLLGDIFEINGRPFTIGDLSEYQSAIISSKTQAPSMLGLLETQSKDLINDHPTLSRLPALIAHGKSQLESLEEWTPIEINMEGMVRVLGKFDVMQTSERDALYDYWEEIYPKFETMKDAINDFCEDFGSEASDVKHAVSELSPYVGYIKVHESSMVDDVETAFTYSDVPDFFQTALNIFKVFVEKKQKAKPPSKQYTLFQAELTEREKELGETAISYDPEEHDKALKDVEETMEEITEQRLLDPILLYLFDTKMETLPISKEDWETMRTYVEEMAAVDIGESVSENTLNEFGTFLDEVEAGLIGEARDIYYLPMKFEAERQRIQTKIIYKINPSKGDESGETHEFNKIEHSTVRLFEELNKLLTGDKAQGIFGEEGHTKTYGKTGIPERMRVRVGPRGGLPSIGEAEITQEYSQMLVTIEDYYVNPIATRYYGTKPDFIRDKNYQRIVEMIDKNPLGVAIGNLAGETGSEIIFNASILKNLADVLEYHRPREELRIDAQVYRNIETAYEFLVRLFGAKELNKIWAAGLIYVMSAGDVPPRYAKQFKEKFGEDIETLQEKAGATESIKDAEGNPIIDERGNERIKLIEKHYPIQYLEDIFEMYEFRDQLGLKQTFSRGRAGEGLQVGSKAKPITDIDSREVEEPHKKEMLEEAKRIVGLLSEINKNYDPLVIALLNAHDIIRKALGKRIIYGKYCLTNADDVDYVLRKTNDDLSVMELEQIVNSVNSFENIGKAFGINEEMVYIIKGMCR